MVEEVEKGRVSSTRKLIKFGDSRAITLPKKWLDLQKWLGEEEVTELHILANDVIILVRPERKEIAKKMLNMVEKESKQEEVK